MIRVLGGDCRAVLTTLPPDSLDACVTDPPYHLTAGKQGGAGLASVNPHSPAGRSMIGTGFMGQQWDGGDVAFDPGTWRTVYRVLKPGAYLVAFGGTRTYHRMVCAIEDAGFEIRDTLSWLYGTGFPKSLDVGKAIDKAAGAVREVVGRPPYSRGKTNMRYSDTRKVSFDCQPQPITAPATPEAAQWQGWGTALKPAHEPIVLARKPLIGTVAANVLTHGVGGLNIDATRVGTEGGGQNGTRGDRDRTQYRHGAVFRSEEPIGRWPANVVHDGSDEVMAAFSAFGEKPGQQGRARTDGALQGNAIYGALRHGTKLPEPRGDTGTAARFFKACEYTDGELRRFHYSAKASATDRAGSKHPTVKPIALMQWLCRLICPPGGHILDPFAGSGTTGEAAMLEGFDCTMIEQDAAYRDDIAARMARWPGRDGPLFATAAAE